jgi:hypothetical protein
VIVENGPWLVKYNVNLATVHVVDVEGLQYIIVPIVRCVQQHHLNLGHAVFVEMNVILHRRHVVPVLVTYSLEVHGPIEIEVK